MYFFIRSVIDFYKKTFDKECMQDKISSVQQIVKTVPDL